MNNRVKVLAIAIVIFIITGCTGQSQKLNENDAYKESGASEPSAVNIVAVSTSGNGSSAPKTAKEKKSVEKRPLEGLTICIDAGHGITAKPLNKKEPLAPGSKIMKAAYASGTSGVATKITEEHLNLSVAKKLKKALSDNGAKIIMIRETSKCNLSNVDRAKLWNSSNADLTIRIHANGIDDSKVSGVLMMIPGDKYIKDKNMLRKSAQAGQYILDGVLKQTKAKSQGTVKSTDLTGFNWSKIPVVLLEMGFMTNPQEDRLLNTDAYQNKMVTGIVQGLVQYSKNVAVK